MPINVLVYTDHFVGLYSTYLAFPRAKARVENIERAYFVLDINHLVENLRKIPKTRMGGTDFTFVFYVK